MKNETIVLYGLMLGYSLASIFYITYVEGISKKTIIPLVINMVWGLVCVGKLSS